MRGSTQDLPSSLTEGLRYPVATELIDTVPVRQIIVPCGNPYPIGVLLCLLNAIRLYACRDWLWGVLRRLGILRGGRTGAPAVILCQMRLGHCGAENPW